MNATTVVEIETTKVYRAANGRRYFTLRGACNASANALMYAKYKCTCDPDTGYTCDIHGNWLTERDEIAEELYNRYKGA